MWRFRLSPVRNSGQHKGKWWQRLTSNRVSGIEDLKQLSCQLNAPLDAIQDVSILSQPVQVGPLVIPNSLAVHPMEGCDGDSQGRPGKLTLRRYERFAGGGAGLIWVEATAVTSEGRDNPRQLWLNEEAKASFTAFVKHIRDRAAESDGPNQRPIIVAQLTHSGRYSKPVSMPTQMNPVLDLQIANCKLQIVTDEYLDELQDCFVEAARLAFEVGFDAVDIKACHGYLINELLASHTREGRYGGSFEGRSRFLLEVIDKIHSELGDGLPVTTRLGIYDAIPYPYGWAVSKNSRFAIRDSKFLATSEVKPDLTEPKKLIALLQQRGVKIINITVGDPHFNPHYGRPYNKPDASGYQSPEHPLVGVSRLVRLAGEIQKEFPNIVIVGTGYSWLRTLFPNVAAASKAKGLATIIGAGRMALAYPNFANDIITKGRLNPNKVCIGCSGCAQLMRSGRMTGCVVRDRKVYGPIYKSTVKPR